MKPPFPTGTIYSFSIETPYFFLSNFYPSSVTYEGLTFSSVEHAYQAAKSEDLAVRKLVQSCTSAAAAKKQGRAIQLREDWDDIKFHIMEQLVNQKFSDSLKAVMLVETGDVGLIEGNYWHDLIWGQCHCSRHNWKGTNLLGIILMNKRKSLINEIYSSNNTMPAVL